MDLKIDSKFALFRDGLWWSKKVPNILIDVRLQDHSLICYEIVCTKSNLEVLLNLSAAGRERSEH